VNSTSLLINDQAKTGRAYGEFLCNAYDWSVFGTHTFAHQRRDMFETLNAFRIWLYKSCGEMAVAQGNAGTADRLVKGIGQDGTPFHYTKRSYKGRWVRQWRQGKNRPQWVVGAEKHQSGNYHLHSLLWFPEYYGEVSRTSLWEMWYARSNGGIGAGIGRFVPPKKNMSVSQYVAKYVIKDGEIFLSDGFGDTVPVEPCQFAGS